MSANNPIRESLAWAKESREQWQHAYEQAIEHGHTSDAEFAAEQIAIYDRIIERNLRFLEKAYPRNRDLRAGTQAEPIMETRKDERRGGRDRRECTRGRRGQPRGGGQDRRQSDRRSTALNPGF